MKAIGDRLKQIRVEARLTKKDIAEILGVPLPVYIGIEENKVDLTLNHLKRLKKEFNISIDWLITGIESYDIENFGEFKGSIKLMLHDMENDAGFMHGIFSCYYESKELRNKIKGNNTPIFPFFT